MVWPASEVLLARHGQTEWNVLGRRQGVLDSPLTEVGRRDAIVLGELAADLRADAVFASPIGRARSTAVVIAQRLDLPVVVLDELGEVDHGAFGGLTNAEIEAAAPGALAARSATKYRWRFPGGESYADADRRVRVALERVAAAAAVRPLLVAHEMVGRMVFRQLLGLDPDEALHRSLPHRTIARFDVERRMVELHGRSPDI